MKKRRYLGSLLDTGEDMRRRKQLSIITFNTYKAKLMNKKLLIKTRMRIFNTYITSIFMYNSSDLTNIDQNLSLNNSNIRNFAIDREWRRKTVADGSAAMSTQDGSSFSSS